MVEPETAGAVNSGVSSGITDDVGKHTWMCLLVRYIFQRRNAAQYVTYQVYMLARGAKFQRRKALPHTFPSVGHKNRLKTTNLQP